MLYLKDTASPQEYDQAVFRLQNQYVKTYVDDNGDVIKYNMKPQTLLVDFMPNRMFVMQETKSKIYNANVETGGNSELENRIKKELRISPIVTINADKIVEVKATDILQAVSNYQKDKGIKDEALETPVDLTLLEDGFFRAIIEEENEIGSKAGLSTPAHESKDGDEGEDIDISSDGTPDSSDDDTGGNTSITEGNEPTTADEQRKQEISLTKKIQSYYVRILLFAFITKDRVISVSDIIDKYDTDDNRRIAKNLGLNKQALTHIHQKMDKFKLSDLDYRIQDLNDLSQTTDLSPEDKANVAVKKFGKLGDAIVITPSNICDDMVNLFPDVFLKGVAERGGRVLDIAGTSGEYAVALCKKLTTLGTHKAVIDNMIYTIPKSSVCYELTRKLYEMLGLNVGNIASKFVATDLLGVKTDDKIDYDKITKVLTQNKPFNEIKLTDVIEQGETDMIKFDAVVGNPPYQGENDSNDRKPPIYNLFMDLASKISNQYCLITPARFLFNAGHTPKVWNHKMLLDSHFKVIKYYSNSKDVFDSVDIKGGVAVSLRNENISFGAIKTFTAYDKLNSILVKVMSDEQISSLRDLVSSQGIYRFSDKLFGEHPEVIEVSGAGTGAKIVSKIVELLPNVFLENNNEKNNFVQIVAKGSHGRITRYIDKDNLQDNEYLNTFNVALPESNGVGAFESFSTPFITYPQMGVSDTFISIGMFDNEKEAQNLLAYVKTKFLRAMLGVKKVTQHNPKDTWEYVPLQDFTENSDIDWSKPISEIDKQLYAKYNLDESEIAFIESMIKPME